MMKVEARDKIPHPLLNPDSKHYQMIDGVEAIERMEQMYSVPDLMAWAKISAMKYRLRISSKEHNGTIQNGISSDAKKIQTYELYYRFLEGKMDEANRRDSEDK